MIITEEFQIHDTLNKKLFDDAGKLRPEVRAAIIKTVQEFEKELLIPINIVDILLCGSNVSYNYVETPTYCSDLDVHIITNFSLINPQEELVLALYKLEKSKFNKKHNITIHGIELELYVQDINSTVVSNGIYSVLDNLWVKLPKPMKAASKKNVDQELLAWINHVNQVINQLSKEEIMNALNTIHLIRHNAIAAEGENSKGNTLFKEIRAAGLLSKLKDAYALAVDRELTIESLADGTYSNGELILRLDEGFNFKCSCDILLPNDQVEKFSGAYYASSKEKAINLMKHFVHEKFGYKVYIRNIKVEL